MESILVSWSGGKDSAAALAQVLNEGRYKVTALLTTVTRDYDRISMHGVRQTLLRQQAISLGMDLKEVYISKNATNEEYEQNIAETLGGYQTQGVTSVVFGDIFLEDLKRYREEKLGQLGMYGLFPIWKRNTNEMVHSFIAAGFKAVTTCVDTNTLGKEFVGREINEDFLRELPSSVDPCGENGEYHTFVYDGPIFKKRIQFKLGERVLREERFYFCDLV